MNADITHLGPIAAIDTTNHRTLRIQCNPGGVDPSGGVVEVKRAWSPRFDSPTVSFATTQTLTLDGSAITEIDVTDIGWVQLVVTTAVAGGSFDFEYTLSGDMRGTVFELPISMDAAGLRGFVGAGYKAVAIATARDAVTTGVLELKQAMGAGFNALSFSPAASMTLDGSTVTEASSTPGGVIYAACTTAQAGLGADLYIYTRDEVAADSNTVIPSEAGSSFPASPSDGDRFYRTDLDMPEWFTYDGGRSKWLGELRVLQFGRNSAASSGSLALRFAGSVELNTSRGLVTPEALTIVGAEIYSAVSFTGDLDFYEGSTNLTTLVSVSSSRSGTDHTLNYDLDADSEWPHKYPQINNVSSGTVNNPTVLVYVRRRET